MLPPCWAVRPHVDIFVWRVPSERSVNPRYRIDRGEEKLGPVPLWEEPDWGGGAGWRLIEHATCLTVCLCWLGGGGGTGRGDALQSHSEIKASSSFIYLFFHQKLNRAAEDHCELGSVCHDEGPGTLASPTPLYPSLPSCHPAPLYAETFHFVLPNCRSPLARLQLALICILGRAVALVLAGVRPLLPLLLCRITRARWNANNAELPNFFAVEL